MIELLRKRLERYAAADARAEEQALKEILQEVTLYALWRADFFELAAFQGGTSLRILNSLPRFSEDLDFISRKPSPDFVWAPYFETLGEVLAEFGIRCELVDRGNMDRAVRQALLKDDSIGRQLNLSFYGGSNSRKLKVKLEIDTSPPQGSLFEYHYLDFPLDFELCAQDLSSNFALKIHALLCRPYLKGRDWFDFSWYVAGGIAPNLKLLQNALQQYGPWAGEILTVDTIWLNVALKQKIEAISWIDAAQDVAPFLPVTDQHSLKLWSARFFGEKLRKLKFKKREDEKY
ncbi:MAG: nucleotidyl transferase AbiEii/AbiGii toxin family protein [Chlorobiales bacterium]|nr:nucleotidyl transferase AbiEii/AbiGii toxin family protein [Chlorobiales bacterium]